MTFWGGGEAGEIWRATFTAESRFRWVVLDKLSDLVYAIGAYRLDARLIDAANRTLKQKVHA